VTGHTACVMCFEKDAQFCHRRILMNEVVHFNGHEIAVVDL